MPIAAQHIEIPLADRRSIMDEIDRLLEGGQLSGAHNVESFEREFAAYTGARHAVAVSSGTMALELALLSLGAGGRSVVVPANTNFATFVAAYRGGANVVLCDVDPTTLSPRLEDITSVAPEDTAAVVLVHMGGIITPEISRIAQWCRAKGIALVEDAAHAHGSRREGRSAGLFGTVGAFSFFATKVMTTGEGGMIVTDDADLAQEARLYRNLGKAELWVSHHIRMGTNGRMTELGAVIGRQQLKRLDEYVQARQAVAATYSRQLAGAPGLQLVDPDHPYSGYKYVVLLTDPALDRQAVKKRMAEAGIQLAGEIYAEPLHHQPALAARYGDLQFPSAELACARQICLPIYPTLALSDAQHVAQTLIDVVAVCEESHEARA